MFLLSVRIIIHKYDTLVTFYKMINSVEYKIIENIFIQ